MKRIKTSNILTVTKVGTAINTITYKYASTSTNITPPAYEVTLDNPPELNETNKYLWKKTTIVFADTTISESVDLVRIFDENIFINIESSKDSVDYYADNVIKDGSDITIKITTNDTVTVTINSQVISFTNGVPFTIKPLNYLNNSDSIRISVVGKNQSRTLTIRKNILQAILSLTTDKQNIEYYADNVPHEENGVVTLTCTSENFSTQPVLKVDNKIVAIGEDGTYTISVNEFLNKKTIVAVLTNYNLSETVLLNKIVDTGILKLNPSATYFGYFGDNEPHNSAEKIIIGIQSVGFSTYPTLIVDNVVTEYSKGSALSYDLYPISVKSKNSVAIEAQVGTFYDRIIINKVMDNPNITIALSTQLVNYTYDNVAITGDISVSVLYSGLMHMPSLVVGTTPIVLNDDSNGTIPITIFDSVTDRLEVRAYAQNLVGYEVKTYIQKEKRQLDLSLDLTAYQFVFDNSGNATPSSITVTNTTRNLSDKLLASLKVGGTVQQWSEDGTFVVTPEMLTGRYLNIELSYGTENVSTIISRVSDGRGEIVEYSKTRSFRIYPDEEYYFIFSDTGLTYSNEFIAWTIPWSTTMPEQTGSDYIWRRSKTDITSEWQYTRITGAIGIDGKQGGGTYIGHYTTPPTTRPDGTDLIDNDYYLNVSTPGEPLPYRYKNGAWVPITVSDSDWSVIASATMDDVNNYGGSLLSTSAYYGFFQNLSANNAFVENLGAQKITLKEQGEIKSDNWDSSNGAEGFNISANGDAIFNSGTWRSSFANGLSFIPPTKVRIDKNMTQKEAYQRLKRAGLAEGHYSGGPSIKNTIGNYSYTNMAEINFSCLDYDSDKVEMNIPIYLNQNRKLFKTEGTGTSAIENYLMDTVFGAISCITPITDEAWLITKGTTEGGNDSLPYIFEGFYVLTLSKLKEYLKYSINLTDQDNIVNDISNNFLIKIDLGEGAFARPGRQIINSENDTQRMWIASPFVWIIHYNDESRMLVDCSIYSEGEFKSEYRIGTFNQEDSSLNNVQTLHFINSSGETISVNLTLWVVPYLYYTKVGDKYYMIGYSHEDESVSLFSYFEIFETSDFINFTQILDVNMLSVIPKGGGFLGLSIVGNKAYTIAYNIPGGSNSDSYLLFVSVDMVSGEISVIPNKYYWRYFKGKSNSIGDLKLVGNKIFGKIDDSSLFCYDTETGVFKDLVSVLASSLEVNVAMYNNVYIRKLINVNRAGDLDGQYSSPTMIDRAVITEIAYDDKLKKIFLPILISMGDNISNLFLGVYLDPNTYEVSIFSPSGIGDFVLPSTTMSGYLTNGNRRTFVIGNTIFLGGYDLQTTGIGIKNLSAREMDELGLPAATSISALISKYIVNVSSVNFHLYSQLYLFFVFYSSCFYFNNVTDFNEKALSCIYDEDVINVNAIAPIQGVNSIDIYETEDEYQIGITDCGMGITFNEDFGALGSLIGYPRKIQTMWFGGKTKVEPFIRINKNSLDTVGASFSMNFPAQITTRPGIDTVVGRQILSYIREGSNINGN